MALRAAPAVAAAVATAAAMTATAAAMAATAGMAEMVVMQVVARGTCHTCQGKART